MGSLVALLLMLSAFVLWLFIKFPPQTPLAKALKVVNRMFLGLAVIMAALAVARVYTTYTDPLDAKLVPQLAAAWSMALFVLVLGIGFIVRNFVVFRQRRYF